MFCQGTSIFSSQNTILGENHLRVIDLVLLALLIRLSLDAAEDWPCRAGDPWLPCHENPSIVG